jgi:hypothetical protein
MVWISAVFNGLYLVGDAVLTGVVRAPAGDRSTMLRYTPVAGLLTIGLLVVVHALAWSAI